ncbi:MAG: EscU/YscU/HrcU family type III secretion system export apparatus switch protein [Lachnospiraceae bacterium]|nr:EscU/YscU/HrcU family type III secretion system export apparatus switch protein [Lachnospiraceae bacterium]
MVGREADILDKNKKAIALSYDKGDKAPIVVASGAGYLADKIIDTAKEAKVPVHKDAKLAESLSDIEIGDAIPPELYNAVAEILLFVTDLEKIKSKI